MESEENVSVKNSRKINKWKRKTESDRKKNHVYTSSSSRMSDRNVLCMRMKFYLESRTVALEQVERHS